MRIWDISAGFLNDKSLLGEHRELHGIVSIIVHKKKGYSRHPETLRWIRFLPGLALRHELLVQEMLLRGFKHHSPIKDMKPLGIWPDEFIDSPARQYDILRKKYLQKPNGRIRLAKSRQQLWATHKYSVMARNYQTYKDIGTTVAANQVELTSLSTDLVSLLRSPPPPSSLHNALLHMWGYVGNFSEKNINQLSSRTLLQEIQRQSQRHKVDYLLQSTALSELGCWCVEGDGN